MPSIIVLCFLAFGFGWPTGRARTTTDNDLTTEIRKFRETQDFVSAVATRVIHYIGNIIPIRGLTSLAADFGVPFARSLLNLLADNDDEEDEGLEGDELHREARSSGRTSYREEVFYVVGALHGDYECMMKVACLSGKKVSKVAGATTLTMILSALTNHMPETMQDTYVTMRDSIMYSNKCNQYKCGSKSEL